MSNEVTATDREVVILVDDNALFLKLLSKWAEDAGYQPLLAHSGEEALAMLQEVPSATVFSDGLMPGMGGTELCQALRIQQRSGLLYFVLLTADEDPDAFKTAIQAGVDDFLTKPIRKDLFTARLQVAARIHNTLRQVHSCSCKVSPAIMPNLHTLEILQSQLEIHFPESESGIQLILSQMDETIRDLKNLLRSPTDHI
jgi:CheY-like chemotaxis protein